MVHFAGGGEVCEQAWLASRRSTPAFHHPPIVFPGLEVTAACTCAMTTELNFRVPPRLSLPVTFSALDGISVKPLHLRGPTSPPAWMPRIRNCCNGARRSLMIISTSLCLPPSLSLFQSFSSTDNAETDDFSLENFDTFDWNQDSKKSEEATCSGSRDNTSSRHDRPI